MANVEHSALTGTDLHEPKGIAAAAANRVYLSNGAASGSWTTVPSAAITAAGVLVFQSQFYHIRSEFSSGTDGGSLASGSWNTRELNTEKTDDLTITTSGNQMSLVAGTYYIEVDCVTNFFVQVNGASSVATNKLRLRNITDSSTLVVGMSERLQAKSDTSTNTVDISMPCSLSGRFTLAGTKSVELQNWTVISGTSPVIKGGKAVSSGENEVYLDLKLWKIS